MTLELALCTASNYGLLDPFLCEIGNGASPIEALASLDII